VLPSDDAPEKKIPGTHTTESLWDLLPLLPDPLQITEVQTRILDIIISPNLITSNGQPPENPSSSGRFQRWRLANEAIDEYGE
jgi:hypothetical protein